MESAQEIDLRTFVNFLLDLEHTVLQLVSSRLQFPHSCACISWGLCQMSCCSDHAFHQRYPQMGGRWDYGPLS